MINPSQLNDVPILILFFSANWCPPCIGLIPYLEDFIETVNSKVYYANNPALMSKNMEFLMPQSVEFIFKQQKYLEDQQRMKEIIAQYDDYNTQLIKNNSDTFDKDTLLLKLKNQESEVNTLLKQVKPSVSRNVQLIYVSCDIALE